MVGHFLLVNLLIALHARAVLVCLYAFQAACISLFVQTMHMCDSVVNGEQGYARATQYSSSDSVFCQAAPLPFQV